MRARTIALIVKRGVSILGVACAIACQHGSPRESALGPMPGIPDGAAPALRTINVRGVSLHYREQGTGPAVVFVHGSMGAMTDWDRQVASFARKYRVIVYSRRFHAPNAPLAAGGEYTMDEHADDLAALIQALHAEPAHVIGHSYGAYTSLRMALRHPELVRSLVLAEPPILGWVTGTPAADSMRQALFADVLMPAHDAFVRGDSVDGMRRFIDGITGRRGRFDSMPLAARNEILASASEMRGEMTTPPERYMSSVTCADVSALDKPTLVLTAADSPGFFHAVTSRLATCLSRATTGVVPDAGHALQVANPESFNQQVLAFLAQH